MKIIDDTYLVSLDSAGTATYTTPNIILDQCPGYSVHTKWTKTGAVLAGTVKTQKSNDGSLWFDVGTQAIVDASGSKDFEATDVFYKLARSTVTITGGKADFQFNIFAKGV